ncbi:MAG: putative acyl-CoA dehydrogenase [Frankiales bacterium]|nr:putative acyl-CoA dehydrogenase [Frankiales bacterium]
MDFALSSAQQAWVEEVRAFLREHFDLTAEAEARRTGNEASGPVLRRFRAAMTERGWLALTWPTEYGGSGRSMFEQFLLMDEFAYWGAPAVDMTSSAVAPTIMRVGTEEQKRRWLPAILRGEVEFAIGYSEPDAGTDLASLRTTGRRDGDDWVITGEKLWNTGAEFATHEWLVCRTDPDAPRHKGLSVFIVPIDDPGVRVQPITTWGGIRTNAVFFDQVRVSADHLVGELNDGWRNVTTALDFERVAIGVTGGLRRLYDEAVRLVAEDGLAVSDAVRSTLAELAAEIELARLLSYRAAWLVDQGLALSAEASMTKVVTTELQAKAAATVLELAGAQASVESASPAVALAQFMYRQAPYLRFGGGTNEVQRDIIAQRGLGLGRAASR